MDIMDRLCLQCSVILTNRQKNYCSRSCRNKAYPNNKGRKFSDDHKRKIGIAHLGMKRPDLAEYNRTHIKREAEIHSWKGDDVGYIAIHNWAHRHVGLKDKCELCGSTERLEMSNTSQQYKREVGDWRIL